MIIFLLTLKMSMEIAKFVTRIFATQEYVATFFGYKILKVEINWHIFSNLMKLFLIVICQTW